MLKLFSLTRFPTFLLTLIALQACNGVDPEPDIQVSPTGGLITSESGTEQQFNIVLITKPKEKVMLDLRSSNENEGTIGVRDDTGNINPVSNVVFTPSNWNVGQTIIITGVDDNLQDGNVAYSIITDTSLSTDPDYTGINPSDVQVINEDDDGVINLPGNQAAVIVSPTTGLTTSEDLTTATFSVKLNSAPTGNVTIIATSNNVSEGTVTSNTLTFTPTNWQIEQSVTVIGVNDDVDDDNQTYSINLTASSSDQAYNNFTIPPVAAINLDNDTAGITLDAPAELVTSENGTSATFTVKLNSQPVGTVEIATIIEDIGIPEVRVDPSTLSFDANNWNLASTFTVTGLDDGVIDGDKTFTIGLSSTNSIDLKYRDLLIQSVVNVRNTTKDVVSATPGVTITPPVGGFVTSERGTTVTFKVVLNSAPTAEVVIAATSLNLTEGLVTSANLIFAPTNWQVQQVISVTGQDDFVDDNDITYNVNLSASGSTDQGYKSLVIPPITLTNQDDDTVGVTIAPNTQLETSENGTSATFTVTLNSQPIPLATIDITAENNSTIGIAEGLVSPISISFTDVDWNQAKTFTVTGLDDGVVDGDITYSIGLSSASTVDTKYNTLAIPSTISVINRAKVVVPTTPGVTIEPIGGITTTEDGTTIALLNVRLDSPPNATNTVTIGALSDNELEGIVTPASVNFDSTNWNLIQTFTITGQDDFIDDGDQSYSINFTVTSGDLTYDKFNIPVVAATNLDNDTAGVTVLPTRELVTSENLTSDTFTVVLNSQPTANASVTVMVDNSSQIGLQEGTVDLSEFTFDNTNWNQAQTFTVTGLDDAIVDGDQRYSINLPLTTTDLKYSLLPASIVNVVNQDNDTAAAIPGVTVTPSGVLETSENQTTATFSVVLNTPPVGEVDIFASSSNTAEGVVIQDVVTPGFLIFTPADWNIPQSITIAGVDDPLATLPRDGDIAYTINLNPMSSDINYDSTQLTIAPVNAINRDNDTPGVTITPLAGLVTSESGATATFTVVLNSPPIGEVDIFATSSNTAEGLVTPSFLIFLPLDWNIPQTFTVTGQNDLIVDPDVIYNILLDPQSSDVEYDNTTLTLPSVEVTNLNIQ